MNATVSFATKARWSSAWPGVSSASIVQAAGLERALDDLEPVPLDELGVAGDVIGMRVRRQQVRDVQPLALDDLVQRLERRAAVDEDGRPARLVGEQVRVREPVGMHAPLDQHGETVHREKGSRPAWPLPFWVRALARAARARASLRRLRQRRERQQGTGIGGALAPAAPAAPVTVSTTAGRTGGATGTGSGTETGSGSCGGTASGTGS